jgi:outer membrane autotransporter protein
MVKRLTWLATFRFAAPAAWPPSKRNVFSCLRLPRTPLLSALASALALFAPDVARAQSCSPNAPGQVAADGCAATVPGGTFDTTPQVATPAFLAQNGGSITATAPVTLITGGTNSQGASALTGGAIALNGGTISTNGISANGLRADGVGSVITAAGVGIVTNGINSFGGFALNGGAIVLIGGTIDTFGDGSNGLFATGPGSNITASQGLRINAVGVGAQVDAGATVSLDTVSITERLTTGSVFGIRADTLAVATANNVDINMSGDFSQGMLASSSGIINITNSRITTSGTFGFAFSASQTDPATPGTPSRIRATDVAILTTGSGGHGPYAYNGAIIDLTRVNVHTSGDFAYGLVSEGSLFSAHPLPFTTSPFQAHPDTGPVPTDLNGINVTVLTTGASSYGALAVEVGTLELTDSSITTTNTGAGGVYVSDLGSVATLLRTTVTSAQFDAGRVVDSGVLLITDSNLSGGRYGISSRSGTSADPNIAIVSGGSLTAASDALHAEDAIVQFTLRNGTAISTGSGNLLNVISNDPTTFVSNATLTTQNIVASGNMISDAASIATVNLTANSIITGIQQNTFATVDGSSTWIMNGNSDIHALTLAGQALFTPPIGDPTLLSSYKTLTTMNYVGAGGTLGLNTFLGTDGSPSDKLVINGGSAIGNSLLRIANTTGAGALTTGNGILVVDTINGGTTIPAAFALSHMVAAGPYEYLLFRGSVDASNPNAWYLRSTIDCALDPTQPQCAQPTPAPGPPDFRPETSLYAAIPSMALLYGRTLLDTLHERVGDEQDLVGQPRLYSTVSGGWGRIVGEHGRNDNGDPLGVAGEGPKFNYDIAALQFGQDFYRKDGADGSRDHGGLYGAIGSLSGGVTHLDGTAAGTDRFAVYTVGGYWTHFGASGWYLDAIMQESRYSARGESNRLPTLMTDGWGFASSLEAGYPIRLGGGFIAEPQVQAVYQTVTLGGGNDTAATVQFRNIDSFATRFGARLANTWTLNDTTRPVQIIGWFRPSFWHEFLGDSQTLFSSAAGPVPFQSNLGGNWVELNAGVDAKIARAATLLANVGYEIGLRGNSYAYNGKVGLRMSW